jgi:hypothetical protein
MQKSGSLTRGFLRFLLTEKKSRSALDSGTENGEPTEKFVWTVTSWPRDRDTRGDMTARDE